MKLNKHHKFQPDANNKDKWFTCGTNVHQKINVRSNSSRSILGRILPHHIGWEQQTFPHTMTLYRNNAVEDVVFATGLLHSTVYYVHESNFGIYNGDIYINKDAIYRNHCPDHGSYVKLSVHDPNLPKTHVYDFRLIRNFSAYILRDDEVKYYVKITGKIRHNADERGL